MNLLSFLGFKKRTEQPIIQFLCEPRDYGVIPEPIPARKRIPNWYKNIPPFIDGRDQFGVQGMSAKKCLPMLDGMSLGFIIPLFGDVNIRTDAKGQFIDYSKNPYAEIMNSHSVAQLGGPKNSPTGQMDAIKFINRWVVKTAPGWSTLFIPPLNSEETRFTCLAAVVDTDRYNQVVNFPAIWHELDFDGVVEAGTPLVVAIPFKRDETPQNAISRAMTVGEMEAVDKTRRIQNSRRHYYTHELRVPTNQRGIK